MENLKIFVISDLHLGHSKMPEYCGRPENHSELILENISKISGDILINCGDVFFGKESYWNELLMEAMKGFKKKVLLLGNHDRHPRNWYLDRGFDDVCDNMILAIRDKRVYFSHKPTEKEVANRHSRVDYNIHGHWHNKDHSADLPWYDKTFHKKISCEDMNYSPILVTDLIE